MISIDPTPIDIRPLGAGVLDLLQGWKILPHRFEGWGDQGVEAGSIRNILESSDTTRPLPVVIDTMAEGDTRMRTFAEPFTSRPLARATGRRP